MCDLLFWAKYFFLWSTGQIDAPMVSNDLSIYWPEYTPEIEAFTHLFKPSKLWNLAKIMQFCE